MAFLSLLPVLSGLLLLWVLRNDRRRHFIQNRLHVLTAGKGGEPPPTLSLRREIKNRMASFVVFPKQLRVALDAAFETTGNSVGFLHLIIAGLAAAGLVLVFANRLLAIKPPLAMPLGIVAALVAPLLLLHLAKSRYQRRFLDVFPDALDLVGRAVRAGLPVNEALVVAGREVADPVGRELRRAFDQVQIGVPIIDALQHTANRVRVADFRFMVVALALQQKNGGSLAETLGNLSGVIRSRKALRLKARGLSAEAKVSALILAILPFLIGAAMYVMNRDLMRVLFVDSRGRFMIGVAFLSLVIGLTTMYVMVKRALR